jgi:hypothetical protein
VLLGFLKKIKKIRNSTLVVDVISEDDDIDGMPEE